MALTEFKIKKHSIRSTEILEVWFDGKLRATITPDDEDEAGIRIVSAHICDVKHDAGVIEMVQIKFFKD
jgi:hypothetical protein